MLLLGLPSLLFDCYVDPLCPPPEMEEGATLALLRRAPSSRNGGVSMRRAPSSRNGGRYRRDARPPPEMEEGICDARPPPEMEEGIDATRACHQKWRSRAFSVLPSSRYHPSLRVGHACYRRRTPSTALAAALVRPIAGGGGFVWAPFVDRRPRGRRAVATMTHPIMSPSSSLSSSSPSLSQRGGDDTALHASASAASSTDDYTPPHPPHRRPMKSSKRRRLRRRSRLHRSSRGRYIDPITSHCRS